MEKYLQFIIQGDSVARGPKLFTDNSFGPLARELPCRTVNIVSVAHTDTHLFLIYVTFSCIYLRSTVKLHT